jgi:hypothetical protein
MFQSCRPEKGNLLPTGILEMNFKVVYDGEPVIFKNGQYTYEDGQPISFEKFNFYISNVALIAPTTNDESDVFDIKLVDFSDTTLAAANAGKTFSKTGIPVGNYSGIRFDLGVPDDANTSKGFPEGKYFGSHPLNIAEQYSETFKSYIFMRLEGLYGSNNELFRFRPATKILFTEDLDFSKNITIQETSKTNLSFEIDLKNILTENNQAIDLATEYETNIENMETLGFKLMDNLRASFSMQ